MKADLHEQALQQNITFEDFDNFSHRVKQTLGVFSVDYINKTIDSMNKRMDMAIKRRGERIKY